MTDSFGKDMLSIHQAVHSVIDPWRVLPRLCAKQVQPGLLLSRTDCSLRDRIIKCNGFHTVTLVLFGYIPIYCAILTDFKFPEGFSLSFAKQSVLLICSPTFPVILIRKIQYRYYFKNFISHMIAGSHHPLDAKRKDHVHF